MATYTDKFSSEGATLKLIVTRESYSITNNTSYLKCELKITKDKNYSSYNNGGASISMTINGSKLYSSSKFDIRDLSVGSTKTIATKYITVSHNSDGTKKITCKASFVSGVALGSASISSTYECGTIPRASSLSLDKTSVNVGSSILASIERKSTDFVHDVEFFISGWGLGSNEGINKGYYKKETGIKWSISYTIPTSWYNYMDDSTSCKAWCRITTRDSKGNQVGSKAEESFTVKVPSDIVPSIGSIRFKPDDVSTKDGIVRENILIQNKNQFTLSALQYSAGTGSSIKSFTFSGPGLSNTTQESSSITGGPVSTTESLTYTIKVTDKRGRTASRKINADDIYTAYCYPYSKPSFVSSDAYKVKRKENSDGTYTYTKDPNGEYIEYKFKPSFSDVKNTNNYTATVYCNNQPVATIENSISTDEYVGYLKCEDKDRTNVIYFEITDNYGGSRISENKTILGSARIMNISPDGTGIAFGKKSEISECFESRYKILARDGLYLTDDSNEYPALTSATDDLWIGATGKTGIHNEKGGTYISAGVHNNIYASKLVNGTRTNYTIFDAENYTEYVSKKPVVLYDPATAESGDITLSDSAANYEYLEIFYRNSQQYSGGFLRSSVKVSEPNNNIFVASITEPDIENMRIRVKTSYYLIEGTKIKKENSLYVSIKEGETKVYKDGTSSDTTPSKHILIYKVLGYK